MRQAHKPSIKREIFTHSIIFSVIILIVFSLFLSNILYRSGMSKAYDIIKQRNYAVNFFVSGYFSEINNTIRILAANEDVQNAPWLDPAGRKRVLNLFKSYTDINKKISFIYAGYKNKELLINDYVPPEGFDPTVRPWYQAAMKVKPKVASGLPYQEIKSREWLFSTSKALFSKQHGYTGVISSDSSIQMIADFLNKRGDVYKSSHSFIAKPDGTIILHHDPSLLKKNMSKIIGQPFIMSESEGYLTYQFNNHQEIAYYSHCKDPDWLIVTVVDKSEIIKPIIRHIFYWVIATGLIAVLLGFAQSSILSRRFSTPLHELQKKVNAIVNGDHDSDSDYQYPENEIGVIAKEVGQLAARELYAKSVELEKANMLLEQKNRELEKLSITDRLTGLYNRHKIDMELEKECQRAVRYRKNLSIIMFDVDWFKKINDSYGHPAGDSVLREIAALLKDNLRVTDIAGRWGGEEFLILLPETDAKNAEALAKKFCSLVANHQFEIGKQVTISMGVATFSFHEKSNEFVKRVDDNLYTAKAQGRNRVVAS